MCGLLKQPAYLLRHVVAIAGVMPVRPTHISEWTIRHVALTYGEAYFNDYALLLATCWKWNKCKGSFTTGKSIKSASKGS